MSWLVLKRKVGEAIVIGNNVRVRLVPHGLAIEAPMNISVHRAEVYDRMKEQGHEFLNLYAIADATSDPQGG